MFTLIPRRWTLIAAAQVLALAGCSSGPGVSAPVELATLGGIKIESMDDVVSLGDFALIFEVDSEQRLNRHGDPLGTPDPPGTPENASATPADFVGRSLSATVIDVVWQGPRTAAPESFTFDDWGWFPSETAAGVGSETVGPDGIRLRPGGTYFGVFAVFELPGQEAEISPLSPALLYEIAGKSDRLILHKRTGQPDVIDRRGAITVSEFGDLIESATVHPALAGLEQAPILERQQALVADTTTATAPTASSVPATPESPTTPPSTPEP